MKKILLICLTIIPIVAFTQNSSTIMNERSSGDQQALPTAKSINSRYYNLLPEGISRLTVNITVKEMKESMESIVNQLYQNGDTLLASQLDGLHTTLTYDRTSDSVNILVSPFEVDESSPMFEGSQNIKKGYHDMISGAFMQFRSLLIDGLLSDNPTENEIKSESDNITVDFVDAEGQYRYTFSNDYKEVQFSGYSNNEYITGLIKARDLADKLVFDYQELITPQIKSILNITYSQEGKTVLPLEIAIKNEIKPMIAEFTLEFSGWKFE